MKRNTILTLMVLVAMTGLAWNAVAETAAESVEAAEATAESTTLTGKFVWTQRDHSDDLQAIFTSTGEDSWAVSFNFDFRGTPHTYTGTAKGSLADGELNGEVFNEDKRRSWLFSGNSKDGTFTGSHKETTEGRQADTGTMTLSR